MTPQGPELGQMLSLLSHELRSPLGVVRGYLRLLARESELGDMQRQAITAALTATERCVDLLGQASLFAQLTRRETPISRTPFVLDTLLALVVAESTDANGRAMAEISSSPGLTLTADRELMKAALKSLVAAVHRAQPLEGTVRVSSRADGANDAAGVVIEITPPADAGGDLTEMPLDLKRGGLGLALPIADAIVDAHGGQVRERRGSGGYVAVVVWWPVAGDASGGTKNEEQRTNNGT